jgi:hypothetical protein
MCRSPCVPCTRQFVLVCGSGGGWRFFPGYTSGTDASGLRSFFAPEHVQPGDSGWNSPSISARSSRKSSWDSPSRTTLSASMLTFSSHFDFVIAWATNEHELRAGPAHEAGHPRRVIMAEIREVAIRSPPPAAADVACGIAWLVRRHASAKSSGFSTSRTAYSDTDRGDVQPPGWKTFWWLTASPSPCFRLPKTIVETMVNAPSAMSAL